MSLQKRQNQQQAFNENAEAKHNNLPDLNKWKK
jgi:hypothetical protein